MPKPNSSSGTVGARRRPVRGNGASGGADRRVEIIERATEFFATRGFAGTSLGDVMNSLGISGPAFYYYFDSKPELLVAMLERAMSIAEVAIDSLEVDPALDPMERAVRAIVAHAEAILSDPAIARVLFTELRELPAEIAATIRARMRDHNARVAHLYAVACGMDVPSPEVAQVVSLLLGMCNWIAFLPRHSSDGHGVLKAVLPELVRGALGHMEPRVS